MGRLQSGFSRVALVVLAILLMAGSANVSAAVFGEGDVCWTVKITQKEQGAVAKPGMLAKFHITSLDPATFVMTGTVTVPGDNPFIMTGTASRIGANIFANLVGTQDHKVNANGDLWRDTSILRATINSTTLNGSIFSIGQSFDRTHRNFDNQDYASGTLTPKACPGVVNPPGDYVTIEGHVYVQGTTTPIQGAVVSTSLDSSTTTTDASGHFSLQTYTPAQYSSTPYTISISATGYSTFSQSWVWGDHPSSQTFHL